MVQISQLQQILDEYCFSSSIIVDPQALLTPLGTPELSQWTPMSSSMNSVQAGIMSMYMLSDDWYQSLVAVNYSRVNFRPNITVSVV